MRFEMYNLSRAIVVPLMSSWQGETSSASYGGKDGPVLREVRGAWDVAQALHVVPDSRPVTSGIRAKFKFVLLDRCDGWYGGCSVRATLLHNLSFITSF